MSAWADRSDGQAVGGAVEKPMRPDAARPRRAMRNPAVAELAVAVEGVRQLVVGLGNPGKRSRSPR